MIGSSTPEHQGLLIPEFSDASLWLPHTFRSFDLVANLPLGYRRSKACRTIPQSPACLGEPVCLADPFRLQPIGRTIPPFAAVIQISEEAERHFFDTPCHCNAPSCLSLFCSLEPIFLTERFLIPQIFGHAFVAETIRAAAE